MRPSNLKSSDFKMLQGVLNERGAQVREIDRDDILLRIHNIIDESLTIDQIIEDELAAQGLSSEIFRPKSDQNYR